MALRLDAFDSVQDTVGTNHRHGDLDKLPVMLPNPTKLLNEFLSLLLCALRVYEERVLKCDRLFRTHFFDSDGVECQAQ
ncbi:MAG: hypothetical protein KF682_15185 [Nitrospira sp.]|nr:hypothetical protein [Nitrospira sp.]